MSDLPPFSGDDPTCPKCGNAGAATEYMARGDCIHPDGTFNFADNGGHALNERLHRRCWRCSYSWDEALSTPLTFTKPEAE